ncbi:MAG: sensor histidine kinase [Peptococcaceae bacterium]
MPYHDIDLLHYLEQDKMLKIIESFNNATGIAININDKLGFPLVEHNYFTGFCHTIRNCRQGLRQCIESNATIGYQSANNGQLAISTCHAGVGLMALPIIVEKAYLGSITCCQLHLQPPSTGMLEKLLKVTAPWGLGEERLTNLFNHIHVISYEKCLAVSNLMQLVINYIAELVCRAKKQEGQFQEKLSTIIEAKARTELETRLRLARLKNLQSQLQPHFLFNTLNTLTSLLTLDKNDSALDVVYSFSEILRYNLDRAGDLVTLQEELKNAENYLKIKRARYDDKISYSFNIHPGLLNIKLPYLSLQPLIENAFIHGLEPKKDKGYIHISTKTAPNHLEITVEDNGVGLPERLTEDFPHLESAENDDCRGLTNVHARLQLCFGIDFGVRLSALPGITRVSLILPAMEEEHIC